MKLKYKILFFLFFACSLTFGQKNIDSINIDKGKAVLKQYSLVNDSSTLLLYSINDDYLIIRPYQGAIKLWYYTSEKGIVDSTILPENEIKNTFFDSFTCTKCFAYSKSDTNTKYNYWHKGFIYCLIIKKGEKICEFNLPTLFQLRESNRRIYPIGDKLNDYLFSKILNYSQSIDKSKTLRKSKKKLKSR
jgi:hypothetical protein